MKKIIKSTYVFLCVMMCATMFAACGGGDDNDSSNSNGGNGSPGQREYTIQNFVGVWKLVHITGHEGSEYYDKNEADLSWESKRRVTINTDGSYLEEDQKGDNTTWRPRGKGVFSVSGEILHRSTVGYYTVSGNENVYHEYTTPENSTSTIMSLTASQFVLHEKVERENFEATLTFQRVY